MVQNSDTGPNIVLLINVLFKKVNFRGINSKQRGKSTFFEKLDPIGRFRSGTCAVLIFELNLTNNVCLLYIKMTLQLVLKTRFCQTQFLVQFWHLLAGLLILLFVQNFCRGKKYTYFWSAGGCFVVEKLFFCWWLLCC